MTAMIRSGRPSLVQEVLAATGTLGEKEDFVSKAARLQKTLDGLKTSLRVQIESRYKNFVDNYNEMSTMISQMESAVTEVGVLKTQVHTFLSEDLEAANRDLNELSAQMNELSTTVRVSNLIKESYSLMEESNELLDQKQYWHASNKLKTLGSSILTSLPEECDPDQVKAFEAIKDEYIHSMKKLNVVLNKDWEKRVVVNEDKPGIDLQVINQDGSPCMDELKQLIQSLHEADMLRYKVNKFASKIMTHIIEPLLSHSSRLTVSITCCSVQSEKSSGRPAPDKVFANLKEFFVFLEHIFSIPLDAEDENSGTFISLLGEAMAQDFISRLISECLAPAIPVTQDKLPEYDAVIEDASELEQRLMAINFISANNTTVSNYAKSVNTTFANKICQNILAKAREYMKEDLHIMIEIESDNEPSDEKIRQMVKKELGKDIDPQVNESELPVPSDMILKDNLFKFPKCQISQSMTKLMKLIHRTLEEASKSNPYLASRLVTTARNAMEMYSDILPVYHKKSLEQLPQLSAVAHNNCMYLSHECVSLGLKYRDITPLKGCCTVTFADLIPKLRSLAMEVFLGQMLSQRDQLLEILKTSGFNNLSGDGHLPPTTEKSLKQILLQLHHLRKVWQNVLPCSVYRRSIGTILNTVLEDLIRRIVSLEDIAADSAVQIVMLFTLIKDKAPEVFVIEGNDDASKNDAIRYVAKFQKFNELIIVLNASLREIEDRWACGKGPLAVEFSVDELKQLIRALFQNTERRATVLSRIKYED